MSDPRIWGDATSPMFVVAVALTKAVPIPSNNLQKKKEKIANMTKKLQSQIYVKKFNIVKFICKLDSFFDKCQHISIRNMYLRLPLVGYFFLFLIS